MSNLLESLRLHDDLMALRTGTALLTPHADTRVVDLDVTPIVHIGCAFTRWAAYCELHRSHGHFDTRERANDALLFPWEWCDGCKGQESRLIAHNIARQSIPELPYGWERHEGIEPDREWARGD